MIENAGYVVEVIWDHEWNQSEKEREGVGDFVNQLELVDRLEPRDTFLAVEQMHRCSDESKKRKGRRFGTVSTSEQKMCMQWNIPLHFSILTYRCGGKLTFPLCRSCVATQLPLPLLQRTYCCHHSDEQRALTGTWCTPELQAAVAKGYVITKIHEVLHFSNQSTDLFKSYITSNRRGSRWTRGRLKRTLG